MSNLNNFNFIIPAELTKGKGDEWKISGLASTEKIDQQGERIIQKGVDLSPIDNKKGLLNWDHEKGPENTIGVLDGYKRSEEGIFVEGRLFKNHTKAKAVKEIMESLNKNDRGRMGLSVEGKILERDSQNPKIIKKCQINAVALTMKPVNSETYADIVKSLSSAENFDFNITNSQEIETTSIENYSEEPVFTANQVMIMIKKALSVGSEYSGPPSEISGGAALTQESLDSNESKKKKKYMKKMCKDMYKSNLISILDKLQSLYPTYSRSEIWEHVKERLDTNYPSIKES